MVSTLAKNLTRQAKLSKCRQVKPEKPRWPISLKIVLRRRDICLGLTLAYCVEAGHWGGNHSAGICCPVASRDGQWLLV